MEAERVGDPVRRRPNEWDAKRVEAERVEVEWEVQRGEAERVGGQ